jgi:hypothetical protein
MVRFAGVMLVFLLLSCTAALLFFPQLKAFQQNLFLWFDCNQNSGLLSCFDKLRGQGYSQAASSQCCLACSGAVFAQRNPGVCGTCADAPNTTVLFDPVEREANEFPSLNVLMLFYLGWSSLPLSFGVIFAGGLLRDWLRRAARSVTASRTRDNTASNKAGDTKTAVNSFTIAPRRVVDEEALDEAGAGDEPPSPAKVLMFTLPRGAPPTAPTL